MTERELLVAILNAIGALSIRTTGEAFVVCAKDRAGNVYHVYPDDSQVTWVSQKGEAVPPSAVSPVFSDTHCPLHEARCDNRTEPQQAAAPSATPVR